ncbi:MAG TPA: PEGA domain-containing protein [Chromatiaceae bacterium]|nr:PEGA domain-containing protein [Chromatiaceae bacterium]
MNRSNFEIAQARVRQRRLYFMAAFVVGAVCFVLVIWLGIMRVAAIDVYPSEASVLASVDVQEGVGVAIGTNVYAFSSRLLVKVGSPGFVSQRVEVFTEISKPLRVQLQEQLAKLLVQTNPETDDIRWRIDGELLVVQRHLATELYPGTYSLEIDSPYYEKKTIDVDLTRGEEKHLSVDLSSVEGVMNIASVPGGSPVMIDGVEFGITPLSIRTTGGEYDLDINIPGYEGLSDQIRITNTALSVSRNYLLVPETAYLVVDLAPPGGGVDGEREGGER